MEKGNQELKKNTHEHGQLPQIVGGGRGPSHWDWESMYRRSITVKGWHVQVKPWITHNSNSLTQTHKSDVYTSTNWLSREEMYCHAILHTKLRLSCQWTSYPKQCQPPILQTKRWQRGGEEYSETRELRSACLGTKEKRVDIRDLVGKRKRTRVVPKPGLYLDL
jgi:hypothetical protein